MVTLQGINNVRLLNSLGDFQRDQPDTAIFGRKNNKIRQQAPSPPSPFESMAHQLTHA